MFADAPGAVGVTVAGRAYGVFAPTGASLDPAGRRPPAAQRPAGPALLLGGAAARRPAGHPGPLPQARLRLRHRRAGVLALRPGQRAELRTTFALQDHRRATAARRMATTPLVALYPHQWKNLGRDLGPRQLSLPARADEAAGRRPASRPACPSGACCRCCPRAAADGNGFEAGRRWPPRCGPPPGPTTCSPRAWTAPGAPTGPASRCSGCRCWPGWPSRWARPRCASNLVAALKRRARGLVRRADARTCSITTGPGPRWSACPRSTGRAGS